MSITKDDKKKIVSDFGSEKKDTGCASVQIAILTAEIENLRNHLLEHKKDTSGKKGMLGKVAKRRRMLNYIKNKNPKQYADITEKLKLRK